MFGFLKKSPTPRAAPLERMHEVAGRTLPLRIVENDRARRLTLRIDAGGQGLRITAPPGMRMAEIDRFMAERERKARDRQAPDASGTEPGTA